MSGVGLLISLLAMVVLHADLVFAAPTPTKQPKLVFREVNITGDEFVFIQNVGNGSANLDEYWLGYVSDNEAIYAVPEQQLPHATLAPKATIVLNNGSTETCDATVVDELGFSGFSNTKGLLVLAHLQAVGSSLSFDVVDRVTWGKLPADAIQIADEKLLPDDAHAVWYHDPMDASAAWQVGDLENCSLTLLPNDPDDATPPPVITWQINSSSPPSIYIGVEQKGASGKSYSIPASDKGLKAPQLSEILPNPASPQLDATDEFIELYNPNAKPFDLSGFMLQSASASSSASHTYRFPAGTKIAPGSFKAFKSEQTHLSLTNSGGQVWFVDPLGTTLDKSDPWGTAKDGQAWIDASGKWQWTLQATPGSTNKVYTPSTGLSSSKTATVNGKKVTSVASASSSGSVAGAQTVSDTTPAQPLSIHPLTLAIVIGAALLYGAYEYRHDLALRYQQYRRNRADRS